MSHKQFLCAHETTSLGYLISMRKALGMLLVHKIQDARLQLLLRKWTFILFGVLAACICGFNCLPMFLAAGLLAQGVCLFAVLLWLGAGDLLLEFALEDRQFFELATECGALIVFEDTDFSLPQPDNCFQSRATKRMARNKQRSQALQRATARSSRQLQTLHL
jgi:hypothetical protein